MVLFRRPVLRIIVALLWMVLQDSYRLDNFVAGLIMATVVEFLMPAPILKLTRPRFDGVAEFFRWLMAVIKLVLFFVKELAKADWEVIRRVLSARRLTPGIIRMKLTARGPGQISLLSALITMTPGTIAMAFSPDREYLYIHCLDASDEEGVLAAPRKFERMIMEVLI